MSSVDNMIEKNGVVFIERDNRTEICSINETAPQEDYITVEFENNCFLIFSNHGDEKRLIKMVNKWDEAVIFCIVYYKKMNDNIINHEKVRKVRELIKNGEKAMVYAILDEFDNGIFSIGKNNSDKISLVENNETATVVYNTKIIVEEVSLSRAYVVLFNYCSKYREALRFIHENIEYIQAAQIEPQLLIDQYMM